MLSCGAAWPQWSPAFTAGETIANAAITQALIAPQWRPAFTAGEKGRAARLLTSGRVAAMEPGLHGRGNLVHRVEPLILRRAAMEPGLHGRGNLALGADPTTQEGAAMEPGLHGRGNLGPCGPRRDMRYCRNGARPSRPGKPDARYEIVGRFTPPQWSPAFTAGETGSCPCSRHQRRGRNGARPSRPGKRTTRRA